MTDTLKGEGAVSVEEATLDNMIQRASVPNLAALIKRGKAAGLIKPAKEYTGT